MAGDGIAASYGSTWSVNAAMHLEVRGDDAPGGMGWGGSKYGGGKRADYAVDPVGVSAESKVPEHVQVPWSGGPSPRAVPSNNRSKGLAEDVSTGKPSRGSARASRLLQSFTLSSLKNRKYKSSPLPQPGSMAEEDAARILKAKNKIHEVFITLSLV